MNTGLELGVVATAAGLGFRHGVDWDHIAALTDLTGTQARRTASIFVATMYAVGHAAMVFALGVLAIVVSFEVPSWLDETMTRIIGLTLLALGTYVVVSLVVRGREFRMRSRWMLLFAAARRVARPRSSGRASDEFIVVVHDHDHDEHHGHDHSHLVPAGGTVATMVHRRHRHVHQHVGSLPDDVFSTPGGGTAFGVGVLHGVGAETPTQVLLFLAAARAGGTVAGMTLLLCFVIGLVAANTVVALTATVGLLGAERNFPAYVAVSVVTAVLSLVVGALFVLGRGALLPPMLGG